METAGKTLEELVEQAAGGSREALDASVRDLPAARPSLLAD